MKNYEVGKELNLSNTKLLKMTILNSFLEVIYHIGPNEHTCSYNFMGCIHYMDHDARKLAFGVSNHVRFKPPCSATETS